MGYGAHIDSGGVTVVSLDPKNPNGLQVDISGVGTDGKEEDAKQLSNTEDNIIYQINIYII